MTERVDNNAGKLDDTFPIGQVATLLGVSERTIRRRIESGRLQAVQVGTSQGYEWRVILDGTQDKADGTIDKVSRQDAVHLDSQADTGALQQALALIEKQEQQIVELAGQCGFLQAKLQERDNQIRALMAPKETKSHSWWKQVFRIL